MCPRAGATDGCSHSRSGPWSGRAGLCCAQITRPGLALACEFSPLQLHERGRRGPVSSHSPASSTELRNISLWSFGVSVWRSLVRSLWVSGKGGAWCQREEAGGRGGREASEVGCEGRGDMGLGCGLGHSVWEPESSCSFPPPGSYSVPNEATLLISWELLGSGRGHLLISSPPEGPASRCCWLCERLEWQWAL